MILADSSIWIRKLRGSAAEASHLDAQLARDAVVGHAMVFGELLIGDRGGRSGLLEDFSRLEWAPLVPHSAVVDLVRQRKLHGRGIGWIDAHLLASAVEGNHRLWAADHALVRIANALGIAWQPPS